MNAIKKKPSILFIDLETQNHPYFGAIASPRHPENFPVMVGSAVDRGPVTTLHYKTKEEVDPQWLVIPDECWLIVAHNAAYEMDWFLFKQRPEIIAFLKRGGRIWCTAYAEYLLSHQLNTYPSLDETAPLYGGTHKVDGIKILWEQGIRTADIDPVLLMEYLSGAEGDVENTRRIFYGQYTKMAGNGMLKMFFERCEGLVFNAFAMDSGLFINRDLAFAQRDAGEARLAELTASFERYRSHIPPEVKFNPGSDLHMSAWLFGGPIKYTGKELAIDAEGNQKYVKGDFVTTTKGALIEVFDGTDLEMLDFDHDLVKYKAGKNKGQIKVTREDTAVPLMRNCEALFMCGPLADLTLFSQQLYKEFNKEYTGKRSLADNSPVYSTAKEAMDMLAKRPEFPDHVRKILVDLQEWARIDKDMGTYYLRETFNDDGVLIKQAGMLQFMTPAGIVHHMLNCTATITTRLSSNKPNMQNLPRGETSDVKLMFTSRFGKDGLIVAADYSAIEVVTLCGFSKDKNLTKFLLDNIDMHCMRLATQLCENYAEVLEKCKNQDHPEHAKYKVMRTNVKPKAFAYQYGATAFGIAFATGCTVEEAQAFIDAENALFPEVEDFFNKTITNQVMANVTQFREQTDDGAWRMYGRGHWQSPGGTCYSFRQYPKKRWDKGKCTELMEFKPTQIRNYPIQGESGFFMQGICGKIMRWLVAEDFFGGRVFIINTVHDAIYLDIHKSVLDAVCKTMKRIMESLPQHFNEKHGYDLHVPFPVEVGFGTSMGMELHWHEGVLDDPKVLKQLGWL